MTAESLELPKTPPGASRVVAVLGMHRSGTSWLAGSLQEKGLEMGEVSQRDPHNRKGNRESPLLMDLHDGVLADNDASWKRPSWPNRWSPERSARLAEHIREMDARVPIWGFKDPRALLLLDEWRRQVGPRLTRVGIFRHPMAVHRSLASRNPRFDETRSIKLWIAYNERLVVEMRREPFPLIRFDVPRDELTRCLERIAHWLELPRADAPSSFFEEELVHADADGPPPKATKRLWDSLESLALRA